MEITRDTPVATLLEIPGTQTFCIQRGFPLFTCSGEFTASLGRLLDLRKVPDQDRFLADLNAFLKGRDKP
jgi:hypothetical protein